jgi:hypothetical protein
LEKISNAQLKYFPEDKIRWYLYISEIPNIGVKLQQLQEIFKHVEDIPDAKVDINSTSFIPFFIKFLDQRKIKIQEMHNYQFGEYLKEFLCFEEDNLLKIIWKSDIQFVGESRLNCTRKNKLTTQVRMMRFQYQHKWWVTLHQKISICFDYLANFANKTPTRDVQDSGMSFIFYFSTGNQRKLFLRSRYTKRSKRQ